MYDGSATEINQMTIFDFKLTSKITFQGGSYLQIQFPPEFSISPDAFSCVIQNGLSGSNYFCSYSGKVIRTNNIQFLDANQMIWLIVIGIVNPNTTAPTGNFVITTQDDQNRVISINTNQISYQAAPGAISLAAPLTRNLKYVGNDIVLTGSLQLGNKMDRAGSLTIRVPFESAELNGQTIQCAKTVEGGTDVLVSCQQLELTDEHVTLQMQEWCSTPQYPFCDAGTQLRFKVLSGFKSPDFIVSPLTKSIEIATRTPNALYLYDRIASDVYLEPALEPNQLTDLSIARSGPGSDTGALNSLQVQATVTNYFKQHGGMLVVHFPEHVCFEDQTLLLSASAITAQFLGASKSVTVAHYTDSVWSIKSLSVSGICAAGECTALTGNQLTLTLSNVRNQLSNLTLPVYEPDQTAPYFRLDVLTASALLISSGVPVSVSGFQTSVHQNAQISISVADPTIGKSSRYTILVTPSIEVGQSSQQGALVVQFPAEVLLQASSSCQAKILSSSNILNCQLSSAAQQAVLSHSYDPSSLRGQQLEIIINQVRNAQTARVSSPFYIYGVHLGQFVTEELRQAVTISVPYPLAAQVTRSVSEINLACTLTINFTNYNPVPANGQMTLFLPRDQIVFPSEDLVGALVLSRGAPAPPAADMVYSVLQNDAEGVRISFVDALCQSGCSAALAFQYEVRGGVNPATSKSPTQSFAAAVTTADNYAVEMRASELQAAPPLSAGQLTISSLSASTRVSGSRTDITLQLTTKNPIPVQGRLIISFPANVYFAPSIAPGSPAVECWSGSVQRACQITEASADLGAYIQSISIGVCAESACASGTVFVLAFKNLISGPIVRAYEGSLVISSLDTQGNCIDSSQVPAHVVSPTSAPQLQSAAVSRVSSLVDAETALDVSLVNHNIIPKNAKILLSLDARQVSLSSPQSGSITCYAYVNDVLSAATTDCLYSNTSTAHQVEIQEFCSQAGTFCSVGCALKFRVVGFKNQYQVPTPLSSSQAVAVRTQSGDLVEEVGTGLYIAPALEASELSDTILSLEGLALGRPSRVTLGARITTAQDALTRLRFDFPYPLLQKPDAQEEGCIVKVDGAVQPAPTACSISYQFVAGSAVPADYLSRVEVSSLAALQTGQQVLITFYQQILFYSSPFAGTANLTLSAQSTSFPTSKKSFALSSLPQPQHIAFPAGSVSCQRSSEQLSSATELALALSFPSHLPAAASISVLLPKDQVQLSGAAAQVQCSGVQCALAEENAEGFIIVMSQTFCGGTCATGFQLSSRITGFSNAAQKKVKDLLSLAVNTTFNGHAIHRTSPSSPVVIEPPLKLANSIALAVTRTTGALEQPVALKFALTVANQITPGNDVLDIKLPPQMVYLQEGTSPALLLGDSADNAQSVAGAALCSEGTDGAGLRYLREVAISGVCGMIDCAQTQFALYVEVSAVRNPPYLQASMSSHNVTASVIDAQSVEVQVGEVRSMSVQPALALRTVSSVSLTRTQTTIGGATKAQLSFVVPYAITSGSKIVLRLPAAQLVPPASGSQLLCHNQQQQAAVPCSLSAVPGSGYSEVTVAEFCSGGQLTCAPGTEWALSIGGYTNPFKIPQRIDSNSAHLTLITASQDAYAHVQTALFVEPDISIAQLPQFVVSRDAHQAGSAAVFTLFFEQISALGEAAKVVFRPPFNHTYTPAGSLRLCQVKVSSEPDTYADLSCDISNYNSNAALTVTEVSISGLCAAAGAHCSAGALVTLRLRLQLQRNTYDYLTTAAAALILRENDVDIAQAAFAASGLAPVLPGRAVLAQLTSSSLRVGAAGVSLRFNLTLANGLLPAAESGSLKIDLPESLGKAAATCTAQVHLAPGTSLGLNCAFSVLEAEAVVTHSLALDVKGLPITVSILNLVNCGDNRTLTDFGIRSYGRVNGTSVEFDSLYEAVSYQASQLGELLSLTLTRSDSQVLAASTFTFALRLENHVPANGRVVLYLRNNRQLIVLPNPPLSCLNADDPGALVACTYNQPAIQVAGLCATGCAAGTTLTFSVNGGLRNAPFRAATLAAEDTLEIYTMAPAGDAAIDSCAAGLFITPPITSGTLQSVALASGSSSA